MGKVFCFYKKTILPCCDVMDFFNIQDGELLGSLSFYVNKNLTTDIVVVSKVFIDKLQ